MSGEISYRADEYADSKGLPFRIEVERHTLFSMLPNLRGANVLDAGCRDGIYSRKLIDLGGCTCNRS